MDPMLIIKITLYLITFPLVFHILKYVRLEEIFRRNTPSQLIAMAYVLLSIAVTQLLLSYFVQLFGMIAELA